MEHAPHTSFGTFLSRRVTLFADSVFSILRSPHRSRIVQRTFAVLPLALWDQAVSLPPQAQGQIQ